MTAGADVVATLVPTVKNGLVGAFTVVALVKNVPGVVATVVPLVKNVFGVEVTLVTTGCGDASVPLTTGTVSIVMGSLPGIAPAAAELGKEALPTLSR